MQKIDPAGIHDHHGSTMPMVMGINGAVVASTVTVAMHQTSQFRNRSRFLDGFAPGDAQLSQPFIVGLVIIGNFIAQWRAGIEK